MRVRVVLISFGVLCSVGCSPPSPPISAAPLQQKGTLVHLEGSPEKAQQRFDQLQQDVAARGGQMRILNFERELYEISEATFAESAQNEKNQALQLALYSPQPPSTEPIEACPQTGGSARAPQATMHELHPLHFRSEGARPERVEWRLTPPRLSHLALGVQNGSEFSFTPDSIGGYRISVTDLDRPEACQTRTFEVAFSPKPAFARQRAPPPLADLNQFAFLADLHAPQAWPKSRGARTTIAFLDTGVNYNHPDLAPNIDPQEIGWDFVAGGGLPYDDEGHGTFLASVAAARSFGVAPQARILGVKISDAFGHSDTGTLLAGLYYAIDHHAQIIAIPVSYQVMTEWLLSSPMLRAAVGNALAQHILITMSGGAPPLDIAERRLSVVAVAAATADSALETFENFGAHVVRLTVPEGSREHPYQGAERENIESQLYSHQYGTSVAMALAAGVLALGSAIKPGSPTTELLAQLSRSGALHPDREDLTSSGRAIDAEQFVDRLMGLFHK